MFRSSLPNLCIALGLLIGSPAFLTPARAQTPAQDRRDLVEAGPGWEKVGDFTGATGAGILRLIHEQIRERQNDGALYQDLGDISLGLSLSLGDDGSIKWDNSFYRRVLPYHEEIPAGDSLEPEDLSSSIDVKTIVSRGRVSYDYLPNLVGDTGVGVRIEGGTALTLAHVMDPLPLGDRPLEEVLEESRSSSISDLLREDGTVAGRPVGDPSLIRLGTEGVASISQWMADAIADRTVDTERGAIFYEGYSDPITQIIDLGVPVHSEFFRKGGPLGVGDRVRHVTFLGLVPVGARLKKYGVEVGYQRFYRYLRETTIFKRSENEIIVVVRNSVATGNEYIPLKIRPEVRILGILRLGYTFFEQLYDRARTTNWEAAYRVDLSDPRGLEAFKALLGEGTRVTFRPLASVAEKGEGAELLHSEVRQGRQNTSMRRAQFFSLINKRDSRIASDQIITLGDLALHQVARTKSTRYRKSFGKKRNWNKLFAVTAQAQPSSPEDLPDEPLSEWDGAVTLVSGMRDSHADAATVERAAQGLQAVNPRVDWNGLMEEMSNVAPDEETRLVLNSLLSLSHEHMNKLVSIDEDRLWLELADLLLGPEHREVWSTLERRTAWRKRPRKEAAARVGELPPASLVITSTRAQPKQYSVQKRFRFARRVADRFARLQGVIAEGDCLSCIAQAFDEWRDVGAMHALFARLSVDPSLPEPGYHYEVFTDAMLRPVTVSNGIRYAFPNDWDVTADLLEFDKPTLDVGQDPAEVESLQNTLDKQRWDWLGSRSLVEPSSSRLDAGMLLANVGTPEQQHCWLLRVFADQEFDPSLRLRIDLRESRKSLGGDRPMGTDFYGLGTPTAVVQTPFMAARYYFDVPIPDDESVRESKDYNLLLRVLNPDGYPVSEEQQLQFKVPEGIASRMPAYCRLPTAARANTPESSEGL